MSGVQNQNSIPFLLQRIDELEVRYNKLKKELQYYIELNDVKIMTVNKKYGTLSAKFSVSSEEIKSEVADVRENFKNYSSVSQTSEQIQSIVGQTYTNIYEVENEPYGEIYDENGNQQFLCYCKQNNTYYRFNSYSYIWEETPCPNMSSVFTQTKDGFNFKGNVAISGKLHDTDFSRGYIEVSSGVGNAATDLGLYDSSDNEIFKIYDGLDYFDLIGKNNCFLTGNSQGVSALGKWNFDGATVNGLENITAVAVFG